MRCHDRHQDTLAVRQGSNYFDNLELVDITLGRIRRALEAGGLWDDTTLIVTGDHPL
jgi:arylsulfatase A-like enzyme